jgi:transposase
MNQVHVIRHKVLMEGLSVRRVAKEMGVSRNTVRRYLERSTPERVESQPRAAPVRERAQARLEQLLAEAPQWTGGKQRLTAARLHKLVAAEGIEVSYTTVKEVVSEWKRKRQEVFVPLVYPPGDLAEVDFFEVLVDIAGKRQKGWMFVMRLMHSGRDFACVYRWQDQVAFLDGHVRAFNHFGCVPQRIAYDNLRAAVRRVLVGAERELSRRFEALCSHYLFEASFCRPGTGHDKGGVEARGRGIRLQELVPIPSSDTWENINAALLERLERKYDREKFAAERAQSLPVPERAMDPAKTEVCCASPRSLVKVGGAHYSVPCDWARAEVTVKVGAFELEFIGPDKMRVRRRRVGFGERNVLYRDYLRELACKPQALRQVSSELIPELGEPFTSAWRQSVEQHGPRDAARVFAKVLGYLERLGEAEVKQRLEVALQTQTPLLFALATTPSTDTHLTSDALPDGLRAIEVESGIASDYDRWLGGGRS